jgi:hypothetical protein
MTKGSRTSAQPIISAAGIITVRWYGLAAEGNLGDCLSEWPADRHVYDSVHYKRMDGRDREDKKRPRRRNLWVKKLQRGVSVRNRRVSGKWNSRRPVPTCCRRFWIVFGDRSDAARCSRKGRNSVTNCSPGSRSFPAHPRTWRSGPGSNVQGCGVGRWWRGLSW